MGITGSFNWIYSENQEENEENDVNIVFSLVRKQALNNCAQGKCAGKDRLH